MLSISGQVIEQVCTNRVAHYIAHEWMKQAVLDECSVPFAYIFQTLADSGFCSLKGPLKFLVKTVRGLDAFLPTQDDVEKLAQFGVGESFKPRGTLFGKYVSQATVRIKKHLV